MPRHGNENAYLFLERNNFEFRVLDVTLNGKEYWGKWRVVTSSRFASGRLG